MEVVFQEEQPEKRPRFEAPIPQTLRIQHKDLAERVFIVACPQCEHNEQDGNSKHGFSHAAPYRRRLLDTFMSTPVGRKRVEIDEDRIDEAIADRGHDYAWQPCGAAPGEPLREALMATGS